MCLHAGGALVVTWDAASVSVPEQWLLNLQVRRHTPAFKLAIEVK